jgi:Replication initiator protein, pSAM2
LDRFWQNLRRAEGWNVQYFGAVEPQRRLAPHAHFAARGSFPKAVLRAVTAATYHQVWWPPTDVVTNDLDDAQPAWNPTAGPNGTGGYVDPATGLPLPTWVQAMDLLDDALDQAPAREPEHVVRFGVQVDAQGVLGGTPKADKLIGYTKYLTKSVAECRKPETAAAVEHQRRLWEQLRITPCSPRCAKWLRYGIQPDKAWAKMRAGHCKGKVHQLDALGIGGRRVLVSRGWSGKTLADHRWDQAAWVRKVLSVSLDHTEPGYATGEDQVQAARAGQAPPPMRWERVRPGDPGVDELPVRLLRTIATRIKQKAALRAAQAMGPPGPNVSATATAGREAA